MFSNTGFRVTDNGSVYEGPIQAGLRVAVGGQDAFGKPVDRGTNVRYRAGQVGFLFVSGEGGRERERLYVYVYIISF